jgi:hypothetical protein
MRRDVLPAVIALLCPELFGHERAAETTAPLPKRETRAVHPVEDVLPGPVSFTY